MDPISMASSALSFGMNNYMSEVHAEKQAQRDERLMRFQNAMNKSNVLSAYSDKVQGLKMAGLNPAMDSQGAPQVATATKANAAKAETSELDPQNLLLEAQAENIKADTQQKQAETNKLKGVDTQNVIADTALKTAQALYTNEDTKRVKEESTRIANLNDVFKQENGSMALFGQTTAQGWQKETWFDKLPKGAKMVIDDIAKGEFDLTVGFVNALDRMVALDKSISDTERDKVVNSLSRVVVEAQMKSPAVMKALAKTPQAQYREVLNAASKLAAETKAINFDLQWSKDKKDVWSKNDPDKLYAEYQKNPSVENAAKWLVSSMRSTGADVVKSTAPAALHGSLMREGMKGVKETTTRTYDRTSKPAIYGADGMPVSSGYTEQGVQSFRR